MVMKIKWDHGDYGVENNGWCFVSVEQIVAAVTRLLFTVISMCSLVFLGSEPKGYFTRGAFGLVFNQSCLQLQQAHWWCQQACGHTTFLTPIARVQGIWTWLQAAPKLRELLPVGARAKASFQPGCSIAGGIHLSHKETTRTRLCLQQSALHRQRWPWNELLSPRSSSSWIFLLLPDRQLLCFLAWQSIQGLLHHLSQLKKARPLTSPLAFLFLVTWLLTRRLWAAFLLKEGSLDTSSPSAEGSHLYLKKQWGWAERRQKWKSDRQGMNWRTLGKTEEHWTKHLPFQSLSFLFCQMGSWSLLNHTTIERSQWMVSEALQSKITILVPFKFPCHGTELVWRKVKESHTN